MNPYTWVFQNPELLALYAGLTVLLAGWVYASFRKQFVWYVSIRAALEDRWGRGEPLPPDDVTGDIFGFCVVTFINLAIIGGFLYLVT